MADRPEQAPEEPNASRRRQAAGPDFLDLPSGKGLSLEAAKEITRSRFTRVTLFAGTANSGKTTLLASVYLLFQKGLFAGYLFAGSDTLVGFETRTFHARTASKRDAPTTARTVVPEYLHLLLRKEDLSEPVQDLLLCDLSGEDFREAKDSSDACSRMGLIRRVDAFVLLIDGEKLATPETRRRAKNDPSTLLRNCLDNGMLSRASAVDVTFTKWDIVESRDDKEAIVAYAASVEEEFRRLFLDRLGRLRFFRVAAQPSEADLPLGFGLLDMFPSWVAAEKAQPAGAVSAGVQLPSEYDCFGARRAVPGCGGKP